jgi:hypothetical protein
MGTLDITNVWLFIAHNNGTLSKACTETILSWPG